MRNFWMRRLPIDELLEFDSRSLVKFMKHSTSSREPAGFGTSAGLRGVHFTDTRPGWL